MIALFYGHGIDGVALAGVAVCGAALAGLIARVTAASLRLPLGGLLWQRAVRAFTRRCGRRRQARPSSGCVG